MATVVREFGCELLEDRRMLAAYGDGEILVQFADGVTAAARDAARSLVQGRQIEAIQTRAMVENATGFLERVAIGKGLSVEQAIAAISRRPDVLFAEPNWWVSPAVVSNDPAYTTPGQLWGMYGDDQPTAIGPTGTTNQFGSQAEKAWDAGFVGDRSVVVGIVDEGFQIDHPDLAANVWVNPFDALDGVDNDGNGYVDDVNGWDFYSNDRTVYDGAEDDHGTHVAGTIGGVGGNGTGVAGVNWNVTMISTKFLGPNGGTLANAVKAIDYLTDLKKRHGINIVASNNSWGGGGYSSALHSAIIRGANAGILFMAAAGNGGSDGLGDNNDSLVNYPSNYSTLQGTKTTKAASYEAVVAVAALNSDGSLASYSNYGSTTVDIAAAGSAVYSTLPGGGYGTLSGTSMATPHVTGSAALYAAAYPAASAQQVRDAILSTTRATSSLTGKTATGGRLDVGALVRAAPPVPLAVSVTSVSAPESQGVFSFVVSLNRASTTRVTVGFATANGSATSGRNGDYTATSGTLTFSPGETSKLVNIAVRNDASVEPDETFFVRLSSASGAAISVGTGTGTIVNDDGVTTQATLAAFAIYGLSTDTTSGKLPKKNR
jgi:hypothetical protein